MILLAILAVPLAAGALSFAARRRTAMEAINLGAFGIVFALAIALVEKVLRMGSISAWNGFLYADSLSALVVLLTALVALLCSVYAVGYFRADERSNVFEEEDPLEDLTISKLRKYYALTPLFVFSMLLVALADNLGVMWVAVEATTLTSVFLVTFYGRATSLEAAWKYAIIGGVGLSMALLGTILTYYSARHVLGVEISGLNWSVLVTHASQFDKTSMKLAFILILLGYGTKAGIAPMHTWKPDAYSEAPVPAAAILSTATLNCALYGLVRFYILATRSLEPGYPGSLLLLFGALSMGIAVPFVLIQRNLRRLLAYSTIDHAGIMITALGVGGPLGALGFTLHMTFHTVTKSLLFLCAGTVYQHFRTDLFRKIRGGVIRLLPFTGTVFLMAALAILGTPPFGLFQSEFVILQAAFTTGRSVSGVLFVLFGAAIFGGVMHHVTGLLLGPADPGPAEKWYPWRDSAVFILASFLVVTGFWLPGPVYQLIRNAANIVSGGL